MNFKNFKSGYWIQQYQYKSLLPEKINQTWTWDDSQINILFEKAVKTLGELNAFTRIVPDIDLFNNILKLKNQIDKKIVSLGRRAEKSRKLINYLYKKPLIDYKTAQNLIGGSKRAVQELIKTFEELNILKEYTGGLRNKRYAFTDYLAIF